MSTHDFRIRATAKPLRESQVKIGRYVVAECTRCGRSRQVNVKRLNGDGLCSDCLASDPNVWRSHG